MYLSTTSDAAEIAAKRAWRTAAGARYAGQVAKKALKAKELAEFSPVAGAAVADMVNYGIADGSVRATERFMESDFARPWAKLGMWIGEKIFDLTHPKVTHDEIATETRDVVISWDPNEIKGPLGEGEKRYVEQGDWMDYTIYFENKEDAETSAQEIRVRMTLDQSLDWSTFEWGAVSFGNQIDNGLAEKSKERHLYSEAKQSGTDYFVVTEANFDETTGTATCYLRIADKTTADKWPKDVHAGILPPNNPVTHCGEGYISYRANVRKGATPGTRINATASIVFDYNAAIETDPAWWNTVATVEGVTLVLGEDESVEVEAIVGAPWGEALPVPEDRGESRFGGWWTAPNGTGTEVTSNTVVEAGTTRLYAFWNASMRPELWLDMSQGDVLLGANGLETGFEPFEVWTATGLKGDAWDWTLLPENEYDRDATNAVIRIPEGTNRLRMLHLKFPRRVK